MNQREALQLALEALEVNLGTWSAKKKAIPAIKEALAESEARRKEFSKTTKRNMEHVEWYLSTHAPEPVAWRYLTRYPTQNVWTYCGSEPETKPEREALYTTPPQRKPSQQELDASYATGYSIGFGEGYEAGKATPPQPEPVIDKSAAVRIATSLGWEPQRKPLTIVELQKHWQVAKVFDMTDAEISFPDYVLITKDVEALHDIKEKNS